MFFKYIIEDTKNRILDVGFVALKLIRREEEEVYIFFAIYPLQKAEVVEKLKVE